MATLKIEAVFLEVTEHSLDPHAALVDSQCVSRSGRVGRQEPRLRLTRFPTRQPDAPHTRVSASAWHEEPAWTRAFLRQAAKAPPRVLVRQLDACIAFLAHYIAPFPLSELFEYRHSPKFTVSGNRYLGTSGQQPVDVGQQRLLFGRRTVSTRTTKPRPSDRQGTPPIGQRYHQQLVAKPDLGPICQQADFHPMCDHLLQQRARHRCIPLPYPHCAVIQEAPHAPCSTQGLRGTRDLLCDTTQMHAATGHTPRHDPCEIPQACDAFLGAQLSNPFKPGMIHTVDQRVSASGRLFLPNSPYSV